MSLGYDPDLPAGFQDADIELREFEEQARELEADEDDPAETSREVQP